MLRRVLLMLTLLVVLLAVVIPAMRWRGWSTAEQMEGLLVAMTAVYAAVTAVMAAEAANSADAARMSAQAAADLVEIEQKRMIAADRPELALSSRWDNDKREWWVDVTNSGPGFATGPTLSVQVVDYTKSPKLYYPPLPHVVERDATERVCMNQFPTGQPWNEYEWSMSKVMLCHYGDTAKRVFHSIYLQTGKNLAKTRYFPPEIPMDEDPDYKQYLDLCKVCVNTSPPPPPPAPPASP